MLGGSISCSFVGGADWLHHSLIFFVGTSMATTSISCSIVGGANWLHSFRLFFVGTVLAMAASFLAVAGTVCWSLVVLQFAWRVPGVSPLRWRALAERMAPSTLDLGVCCGGRT